MNRLMGKHHSFKAFGKNGNFFITAANQRRRICGVTNFGLVRGSRASGSKGSEMMKMIMPAFVSSNFVLQGNILRFQTTGSQNDRLRRLRQQQQQQQRQQQQQPPAKTDAIMEQVNVGQFPHESRIMDLSEVERLTTEILAKKPNEFYKVQQVVTTTTATTGANDEQFQVVDFDDDILQKTRKVIRHYSSENNPRFHLSSITEGSKGQFFLPGAHICHNILTSKVIPQPNMILSDTHNNIDSIIEMFFLTILSFGHFIKASSHRYHKSSTATSSSMPVFDNGIMSEELLRLLFSTQVLNQPGNNHDDGNNVQTNKRKRMLLLCYNSALGNWAKIAGSKSVRDNQSVVPLCREAAMKAERLLLEMALVRSQNHDVDIFDNNDDDLALDTLLSYVQPDVVSFNTVISAWSGSVLEKPNSSSSKSNQQQIESNAAPERAEAILTLMKDLSDESATNFYGKDIIRPDRRSYDAVIQAWSRSSSPEALDRTLRLLHDMMDRYDVFESKLYGIDEKKRHLFYKHNAPPIPTANTLSSVFLSLTRNNNHSDKSAHVDAEKLLSQVKEWYYEKGLNWTPDTVLYNSLLSVIAKHNIEKNQENIDSMIQTCHRIDTIIENLDGTSPFLPKGNFASCQPDLATFGVSISSWSLCAEALSSKIKGKGKSESLHLAMQCADNSMESLNRLISATKDKRDKEDFVKRRRQSLPSINNFNDVIKAYGIALKPEKAEEVMRLAQSSFPQVKLSSTTYQLLIDAYIHLAFSKHPSKLTKEEAVEKAGALLNEMEQMISKKKIHHHMTETPVYNNVIEAYTRLGKLKNTKKADEILTRMINLYKSDHESMKGGMKQNNMASRAYPNTFSFNTVLVAYGRLCNVPSRQLDQHAKRVEELIQTMEDIYNHTRTNTTTYRLRKPKSTPQIYPNVITYNILLSILSKQARFAKKISDAETYVRYCQNLIQKMEEYYVRGINRYTKPDKFSYAALLSAIAESRSPDSASRSKEVLDHITTLTMQNFCQPVNTKDPSLSLVDIATLNIVLKSIKNDHTNENKSREALDFLERMKKGYFLDPTSTNNNTSRSSSTNEILNYRPEIYPDKVSYCTVMSTVAKEGTMEAARRCLNLLSELEDEADTVCYNTTLTAFTNVGTLESMDKADQLFQQMVQKKITDDISYSILIHGWKKVGNPSRAQELKDQRKASSNKK